MKKTFVLAALSFLAIGMNAQNLIKNGTFDTPLNAETYESVPASADWFVMDKTSGATTITPVKDDEKHGNVVQIENTTDNSWYKAFLAQRLEGAEKGVYTLSFEAKALTEGAQVRFFICDSKLKTFIMRDQFDLTDESSKNQSATAFSRVINKPGKWMKVTAKFDLAKTVDNFASVKSVEAKGNKITESAISDEMLKDLIVVIELQKKDSKMMIDNVTLQK